MNFLQHLKPPSGRGFTLVELMVVLVVIAVFATIAFPSYQGHVKKTRLHQAHSAMLQNSRAMDSAYQRKLSYKTNATTWMTLPIQETEYFCLRLIGNPRGAAEERYSLKAVALDVNNEPRVLKLDQDGLAVICQSSESRCTEKTPYFRGGSSVDKECTIFGA